jgi:AcrR family transcriptional regulator
MEDLENMEDESFMEKYGCDKDEAVRIMEGDSCDSYDDEDEDEEENKKAKKAKKDEMKMKVKEDVDAMLSGENLSEEFKEKASMIFEAAVEARVEEIASELEEKYIAEFEETLEVVKEDFASKLDSYLDYVVENWMAENELAIEKGLRSEIVEDFIGALKNVFVEHYIDIPEDKVDIVEQLADRVEELEDQINEQHLKNIDLKKSLSEHRKEEVVHLACEGLTLSQAEKVRALAKNVEFVSEEDFSEKLVSIKESYFPTEIRTASTDSLNDMIEIDEDNTTKVVDPLIESYVNKITRLAKF